MARPNHPLFLARMPHCRRRLRDAARMLPVFGAVLMLWTDEGTARLTSRVVI